ncbi:MAG: replication protein [Lachnospiraceae bacterium]|nr:replication protein [Lachnospiraceae bacterium]
MEKDVQARKWQLTINNPNIKGWNHERIKRVLLKLGSLQYYCMSDEKSSTIHTHIYIFCRAPVRFSTLKNRFPEAHIEKANGTSVQNRAYVFKEGKWKGDKKHETNLTDTHEEWGELPIERQGKRNDLENLYELVMSGKSNYEILEQNPDYIKQIERIDKVRQIIQEEAFKDTFRELFVEYYFGDTGSGKTRSVMERYGYANVFRVTNYRNPFDQYKGQDVIIFEEFSGAIPISQMLTILDGYPVMLPCRYADKVACFTKVYILSNMDLTSQYPDIQKYYPESWNAFLRRINSVTIFKDNLRYTYTCKEYINNKNYENLPFD